MDSIQMSPVIFFQGNCKEAMLFYHDVLGGALTMKTYAEEVGDEAPHGWGDKIAYAVLETGGFRLKAWDSKLANPEARKIELQIIGDDEPRLQEIFEKLCADGGKAKHAIERQVLGGRSGRLFDRFGLDWIVTVQRS